MTDTEFVLVTEYFHPDTASTGRLMTDLAVGLSDRGLDMSVYTGQPHYHGDVERQPAKSRHRGVTVRRVGAPQVRQSSLTRRLLNWTLFSAWTVAAMLLDSADDREVVFVSNPPFLPIAMWVVCRLKGWEYTYIVHDLYPDVVVASGHLRAGGPIARTWSKINEFVLGDAKHVVALGPVMRDRIIRSTSGRLDPGSVHVIHNWQEETFIRPLEKDENPFSEEHGLVDTFSLVYSGNIGANHDLETVVRAAAKVHEDDVEFLIIGEGDSKRDVVELAVELGVEDGSVEFLPYQDLDVLPYSLTSGDVSIVSVAEGMTGLCVSSKMYTALAAGKPILLIADGAGDEARIVAEHDAGIQVEPGDVDGVVRAIKRWRSDPDLLRRQGENARSAFEANYTKERSIDEYYRVLSTTRSGD